MSADDEDVIQEIAAEFTRISIENYCIIASSVLLFADTITTFTDEVQRIWHRKFTGATVVFLITRYVAVAERLVLVVSVFLPTLLDKPLLTVPFSCAPVLRLDDVLTDISYLMFGIFMMLRTRGIWGRGWIPIAFLALLTPVRTAITVYVQTQYIPIAFGAPLYGCGALFNLTPATIRPLGIASRAAALTIDAFVLVLTWIRTLSIKRESHRLGMHTPLVTLLLRDGTIYFVIILFVQIFSIVSVIVGNSFVLWDVWPYFDQVFTVIFTCRFMLSLRRVYLSDRSTDTEPAGASDAYASSAYFSTMRFSSSIVGNMGAPLDTFGTDAKHHSLVTSSEGEGEGDSDELESEAPEMSRDPLLAGLHHPAGIELPEAQGHTIDHHNDA